MSLTTILREIKNNGGLRWYWSIIFRNRFQTIMVLSYNLFCIFLKLERKLQDSISFIARGLLTLQSASQNMQYFSHFSFHHTSRHYYSNQFEYFNYPHMIATCSWLRQIYMCVHSKSSLPSYQNDWLYLKKRK